MPLFRRANRLVSSVLTLRSSKKTARNKTKRKMAHQNANPWVMMLTFHLWNERLIPSSEEVPASEEVFASITELCSGYFFIFPLLWHNRTAVTFSVLCSCWDCYAFRLTVPKTSADQCWLRKSSPTKEALLRLGNGLGRHFLGRDWPYKPSELRA